MYQTNHNKLILEFFRNHADLSIPSLRVLEEFKADMDRATIYRNLNQLVDQKYLRKSYNIRNRCYEYQYGKDCENHLHLICKSCGKILHLECASSKEFIKHISLEHNFIMDQGSTMIFGLCKECS